MSDIASRLRKAMAEQREGRPGLRRAGADTETAMRPVREAAEELRAELAHVPQVAIHTDPDAVWIDIFDRHLWFSYDPVRGVFVGSELDSLWMEGGLREERFQWPSAQDCVEGLVQTCARCAVLAEAAERLGPAPARDPRSG